MRVCLAELPRHWVILAKDKSGLHLDEYHLIEFKDMPLKEYDRETKAVLLVEDPKCLQPQEFWQTKSFFTPKSHTGITVHGPPHPGLD